MTGKSIILKTTSLATFRSMPTFEDLEEIDLTPKTLKKRSFALSSKSLKTMKFNCFDDDFDDPIDECPPPKQAKVRKICEKTKQRSENAFFMEDLEPRTVEELAVNPKKVYEVKEWILRKSEVEKGSKLLLITGPNGSGKTATIKALCYSLGIEFVEAEHQEADFDPETDSFNTAEQVFEQWLRSNEHISVATTQKPKKLVLIEHLPNIFYMFPNRLIQILSGFTSTRSIYVIIMSTIENCWDLSPSRIFSEATLNLLAMDVIKFNSVATTFMKLALKRIFTICGTKVSDSCLKDIIDSADGDIRAAMNTVKFSSSQKALTKHLTSSINHLSTFHYVGKVMYAKRLESSTTKWRTSELKLKNQNFRRSKPPKDDINFLVEASRFTETRLADYVFEHEPNFSSSIENCTKVLANLCEIDSMMNGIELQLKPIVDHYVAEITIRSTMYYNFREDDHKREGMYKFQKPKIWDLRKIENEKKLQLLQKYPRMRSPDLFTNIVPLILQTRMELGPEEKLLIDGLSMKSLLTKTIGNCFKINPRPMILKPIREDEASKKSEIERKFDDFVIDESESDDDW